MVKFMEGMGTVCFTLKNDEKIFFSLPLSYFIVTPLIDLLEKRKGRRKKERYRHTG